MPTFDKDMGDLEQFFELDLAGFRELRSKAAALDELRARVRDQHDAMDAADKECQLGLCGQTALDVFKEISEWMDELEGSNDGHGTDAG